MAHKQLAGLTDQLGLVNYQLREVGKLEADAPQKGENAPFPVVMSATTIGRCLGKARHLLEEAAELLQAEISFYEASDRKIEEINAGEGDDATKADAVTAETKAASAREAETAGIAAYCMQAVPASVVFMAKGMEKARSYRV